MGATYEKKRTAEKEPQVNSMSEEARMEALLSTEDIPSRGIPLPVRLAAKKPSMYLTQFAAQFRVPGEKGRDLSDGYESFL
jgi:hypothetical protein